MGRLRMWFASLRPPRQTEHQITKPVEFFDSLVYLDREFIATAYEALTGQAPDTLLSREQSGNAGASLGVFSSGVSTKESRAFRTSAFGMLTTIWPDLRRRYKGLDNPPLASDSRSVIGWIHGELSVAKIQLRKGIRAHSQVAPGNPFYEGKDDASEVVFTLRSKQDLHLTLITSEPYFASGIGVLPRLEQVVLDEVSIPVHGLVKVIEAKGSFQDWLAIPLLLFDAKRHSSDLA